MPRVDNTPSDKCAICGKHRRKCKHPWDTPFDQWPSHLITELPFNASAEGTDWMEDKS